MEKENTAKVALDRLNIKVSNLENEFYYDKKNVTCEYRFVLRMPYELTDLIGGSIVGRAKATAFCHEDDNYDKTLGEKIALCKAECLAYNSAYNELRRRINRIYTFLNAVEPLVDDFRARKEKVISHNLEYIKKIGGEN